MGPNDDIVRIEYTRHNSREKGPALVGISTKNPSDFDEICNKMKSNKLEFKILDPSNELFKLKV